MFLKLLKYFLFGFCLLLGICCIRTLLLHGSKAPKLQPCKKSEKMGFIKLNDNIWERFRDVLKLKTISYSHGVYKTHELKNMLRYLFSSYSDVFTSELVDYEVVNNYSLLIHVKGGNKDLEPYLLLAHLDVVPVQQDKWKVDAFGAVEDKELNIVYGRGTLDDKAPLMAIMEALLFLLKRNIQPEREFYIAFGHDEEVRGRHGAGEIAKVLKRRNVNHVHFILDEGLLVFDSKSIMNTINKPIAMIGVSEKGYLCLNISIDIEGGHSSMPSGEDSITILTRAISRFQSTNLPSQIDEMIADQLMELSYYADFPFNIILSNLWLFKPLVIKVMEEKPHTKAFVQTTNAVTMFHGGVKQNVIATSAWAIINFRVHSQDSIQSVLDFVKKSFNDDRLKITVMDAFEHHAISPYDSITNLPYQVLSDTIGQIYPDVAILPGNLIANTDTVHYMHLTDAIYRFQPAKVNLTQIKSIHGENEYISKDNYEREMNFYYHLMVNSDRKNLRMLHSHNNDL